MLDEAVWSQELDSMTLVNPFHLGMFYDFIFSLYFFPKLSFYYFTQQQHLLKQLQQSANK